MLFSLVAFIGTGTMMAQCSGAKATNASADAEKVSCTAAEKAACAKTATAVSVSAEAETKKASCSSKTAEAKAINVANETAEEGTKAASCSKAEKAACSGQAKAVQVAESGETKKACCSKAEKAACAKASASAGGDE